MGSRLKILHIARISNEKSKGVNVAVPEHVLTQGRYADTFLLNVRDDVIQGIENQICFNTADYFKKIIDSFGMPDMAVFHEVYIREYISIAAELNKRKIPYIIIPHGSLTEVSQQKSKFKKTAANILFFNAFIKNAKAIQCLSEAEKESTKVNNQKFVSSNGVYMPEKIKKDFLRNEGMKFIYIGRLEYYYKGLDLLISAARLCSDFLKENKCKLYIYGTDKNGRFEYIKSLTEQNGVTDIVELNHGIFGEEKENELLSSDCFIQTSRSEGMPLGILEALSYGIPCLVTYGTRLGEAVESNDLGWVCNANEKDIASTIRQAVNERYTLVSKSSKAVEYIQKNYEWDFISSNAIKIYNSLIKDKKEVYIND